MKKKNNLPTLYKVRHQALRIWQSNALQRSYINDENLFPIVFLLPKISAQYLQQNFAAIRSWIVELQDSKLDLIYKGIQHRQLGKQSLPYKITFLDQTRFLNFIDRADEYNKFRKIVDVIIQRQPTLKRWLSINVVKVLDHQNEWSSLLDVCTFFQRNSYQKCYIRELDISGIDTKYIENHKKILGELLDELLPEQSINQSIPNLARNFEGRYGLKYDQQSIRFRILDQHLFINGLSDLSIPIHQFASLNLKCTIVFITENKINGLTFPPYKNAIVIFGLGYGIQSLRKIPWLLDKEIIYWGDIDTHGFSILSQLRNHYPQIRSILMDQNTLQYFKHLWVQESPEKCCNVELNYLTPEELETYQLLKNNDLGVNIRLEQERIGFKYVKNKLNLDHALD